MDYTAAEWEELLVDIEKVVNSYNNEQEEPGVYTSWSDGYNFDYAISRKDCTIETKRGKLIVEFDDGQLFADWKCRCHNHIYEDYKVLLFNFSRSTPIISDVEYRVEFDLNGKVRSKQ